MSINKNNNFKIILQTWNLENKGWHNPLNIKSCGFSTSKSWINNNKNWGLVFCIVKGKRESYYRNGFSNCEQLPLTNKNIYILWQSFRIGEVELCGGGNDSFYYVHPKEGTSTIFDEYAIILDQIPGFEIFERKYMRTGMTNIANDETGITRELLRLSKELPLYPGF
ncbi:MULTISPECIES: hypothetical protein [unclassified Nodularia (in: cyanobacteria)]|uniref:hypothetical protein n=1 Tax=unclassified Nodularia (in: cyanobacteria) TaxID=2656917 RepID=UPI00187EE483|nr:MULTISPECIES: hypothetical protein [unclassified Nodularia (in: cyanobacteria)]MBE9197803.1 hypothetical protein [Nodularia sp. LEGE 06071]MCC2695064.1 hypothetical protein [Nodularia sp. LEGE 04288]